MARRAWAPSCRCTPKSTTFRHSRCYGSASSGSPRHVRAPPMPPHKVRHARLRCACSKPSPHGIKPKPKFALEPEQAKPPEWRL
eukprot:937209-Prorocentrum_minimum.AAC.4